MNEHVNPVMVEALRGHWPLIEPGTAPDEAQRVAADLDFLQHREASRNSRALVEQVQHDANMGVQ